MFTPKNTAWLPLILMGFLPGDAPAQEVLRLEPGDRVRVTASKCDLHRDVGTVISVTYGILRTSVGGREQGCPFSALQRLELSVRQRMWWESAAKGAGVGAAVGLGIVGAMASDDDLPEDEEVLAAFKIAGASVAAGAVVGTLVGVFRGKDVWDAIRVRDARPFLSQTRDGRVGFGFSKPIRW